MIFVGIDPGTRMCGVAISDGAKPVWAGLVRSNALTLARRAAEMAGGLRSILEALAEEGRIAAPGSRADHGCVELPQFYGTDKSKGDVNDLIDIAFVGGAMTTALGCVSLMAPLPRQWKGTLPKEIHHERLQRDYPAWIEHVERDTPKSMRHHVWDAVGLAVWIQQRT